MADSDQLTSIPWPVRLGDREFDRLCTLTRHRSRELAVSHRVLLSFRTRGHVYQPPT
jgi:hypothetical protein